MITAMSVYGDQVYSSTDLNRRSGEILNSARNRPVTISRNGEQFALLRREQAAALFQSVTGLKGGVELAIAVVCFAQKEALPLEYEWIKALDLQDRRTMCREVLEASLKASQGEVDWAEVDNIIHEWRETGLVSESGVLDLALKSPVDYVRVGSPSPVIGAGECEPVMTEI